MKHIEDIFRAARNRRVPEVWAEISGRTAPVNFSANSKARVWRAVSAAATLAIIVTGVVYALPGGDIVPPVTQTSGTTSQSAPPASTSQATTATKPDAATSTDRAGPPYDPSKEDVAGTKPTAPASSKPTAPATAKPTTGPAKDGKRSFTLTAYAPGEGEVLGASMTITSGGKEILVPLDGQSGIPTDIDEKTKTGTYNTAIHLIQDNKVKAVEIINEKANKAKLLKPSRKENGWIYFKFGDYEYGRGADGIAGERLLLLIEQPRKWEQKFLTCSWERYLQYTLTKEEFEKSIRTLVVLPLRVTFKDGATEAYTMTLRMDADSCMYYVSVK